MGSRLSAAKPGLCHAQPVQHDAAAPAPQVAPAAQHNGLFALAASLLKSMQFCSSSLLIVVCRQGGAVLVRMNCAADGVAAYAARRFCAACYAVTRDTVVKMDMRTCRTPWLRVASQTVPRPLAPAALAPTLRSSVRRCCRALATLTTSALPVRMSQVTRPVTNEYHYVTGLTWSMNGQGQM